jgi:hypothetical protein
VIEQAIYSNAGGGGYRFTARSPGFADEWLAEAERLCTGFGERPAETACPACVFAQPFGPRRVAVVQAADQGRDDAGRPGALGFRLLVLPREAYFRLGGDPFHLADQFPPPWDAHDSLPTLFEAAAAPPRTVAALHKVLDVPHSATLLGGVQALLDGGRLVFERSEPDDRLLRQLWALLPDSSRAELWPASFAFGNAHRFEAVVVPRAPAADYPGYLFEEQAGDYPEGRYELALQTAVESGNQADLDALLARRSRRQMVRLAWLLLAVFVAGPVIAGLLRRDPAPPPAVPERPVLADAKEFPEPQPAERRAAKQRLGDLCGRLKVAAPAGDAGDDLNAALDRIDAKLGAGEGGRDPGPLSDWGPFPRRLRALLWKHGVPDYAERGLNFDELLDRLEQVVKKKAGG